MTSQATIKQLALDTGFTLKEQTNGEMDLSACVYEFAAALLEPLQETIRALRAEKGVLVSYNHSLKFESESRQRRLVSNNKRLSELEAERDQLAAQNERLRQSAWDLLDGNDGEPIELVLTEAPPASLAEHDAYFLEALIPVVRKEWKRTYGADDFASWLEIKAIEIRHKALEIES